MPYRAGSDLADLFQTRPVDAAAERITRRVGERLLERVAFFTPVAKPYPAVALDTFISERGGRVPGELKSSWRVGELTLVSAAGLYRIVVYTEDPVAPYVEWDTEPHLIVPRRPAGTLRFRDRDGNVVFAKVVHHPGTRGAHMMATALAEVALTWRDIGREEIDRWAHEAFLPA